MPELPEVEVVRLGLQAHVLGRPVADVRVLHPRAARRHAAGPLDLQDRLRGRVFEGAHRRGKYLWLALDDGDALVVHLGMSGQLLVQAADAPPQKHLRVAVDLAGGAQLRFVDQRTFGGWALAPQVLVDGSLLPAPVAHIARDPLDPRYDRDAVVRTLKGKDGGVKRLLLDQALVSGIGNIYADEALWRARVHGGRRASALTKPCLARVLDAAAEVMAEALAQGGTSFDALYVNVNGQSGYFDRSLNAYGREGLPCRRCGAPIRREAFMGRSSFSCPVCQPRPALPV